MKFIPEYKSFIAESNANFPLLPVVYKGKENACIIIEAKRTGQLVTPEHVEVYLQDHLALQMEKYKFPKVAIRKMTLSELKSDSYLIGNANIKETIYYFNPEGNLDNFDSIICADSGFFKYYRTKHERSYPICIFETYCKYSDNKVHARVSAEIQFEDKYTPGAVIFSEFEKRNNDLFKRFMEPRLHDTKHYSVFKSLYKRFTLNDIPAAIEDKLENYLDLCSKNFDRTTINNLEDGKMKLISKFVQRLPELQKLLSGTKYENNNLSTKRTIRGGLI